jgi:dUTP pyrophosphatase
VTRELRVACIQGSGFLPEYQSAGSAGADLRADLQEEVHISPGGRASIPTGLRLEIPRGFEGQVRPRSGLALRQGVTVLNTPGTIDSDYRGEIRVVLVNLGQETFTVRRGDRVAQIVFAPTVRVRFTPKESIDETTRGEGGFGSTGV